MYHPVIGVRFKQAGKIYYFDPDGLKLKNGDCVIVETSRGIEQGRVVLDERLVSEEELVSPLKKVIRQATKQDEKRIEEQKKKELQAAEICKQKIAARGLPMKLVNVEYTFDDNKIIFNFTAEGRIDFRELVKDLAAVFRTRIELRQIGIRDEAKTVGGLGCCGQELCCKRWLMDFHPVSIKMAKTQNLSLNTTKISGSCSRLMCCLNYENEVYEEFKSGFPKEGTKVMTPVGEGKVVETNIFRQKISVELVSTKVVHEFDLRELVLLSVDDSEIIEDEKALIEQLHASEEQGDVIIDKDIHWLKEAGPEMMQLEAVPEAGADNDLIPDEIAVSVAGEDYKDIILPEKPMPVKSTDNGKQHKNRGSNKINVRPVNKKPKNKKKASSAERDKYANRNGVRPDNKADNNEKKAKDKSFKPSGKAAVSDSHTTTKIIHADTEKKTAESVFRAVDKASSAVNKPRSSRNRGNKNKQRKNADGKDDMRS